jgi:NADH:ubiquinone oxidoreductase subunit 6 (subunit J)
MLAPLLLFILFVLMMILGFNKFVERKEEWFRIWLVGMGVGLLSLAMFYMSKPVSP